MNVEALNCPNCSAGVDSDKTQCQFCRSRLKTMACPLCVGLMFEGSKYCGHCGARSVVTAVLDESKLGDCPRCKIRLKMLQIAETAMRECERCDGLWADVETFEHFCQRGEEQSAVLGFMDERPRHAESPAAISYVPCPDCSQLMNRSNFAKASGVILDTCRRHGIWFDADELPKIIAFIQKGGMEFARKREMMAIEAERDQLRDEQRRIGIQNRRFDMNLANQGSDENGIKGFLNDLFG